MITFTDTTLAEGLKDYQDVDSLGKATLELKNKVATGDISLLPEDIRKDPTIANYKNLSEVAKGLIETKKLVGQIKKAPETPDGYKFTETQNLHKGLTNVEDTKKGLMQMFHKVGIDNDKADALQQMILTALSTGLGKNDEARQAKAKETETKLRSEWGENYDKNFNNVKNVLERIGLTDLVSDLGTNPQRIAGFHKLTSLLSEDSIGKLGGEGGGAGEPKTNAEGLAALKKFNEDVTAKGKLHPLLNEKDPGHKKAVEEYNKIMKVAYEPAK